MPTYIRVKDLANAATTPATDDFILLSGAANGARKISRADFLTAVAGFYTADPSTYKLATLDAGDKVLVSQLPSSAFSYKGTWAASTNTPTLANGTGTAGDTYYASDSGSVNFGAGSISFLAGDAVVYDGTIWQKVPDVVNLLDGKGTLDEAKTTLEIPDVGTAPNETPLNQHLGSLAYADADSVAMAKAEIESTTGTASTQALTVTDGTTTGLSVQEDGKVSVRGKVSLNVDGSASWGSAEDYGKLTWDTGKAIVRGESGKSLSLGSNGTQDHLVVDTSGNVDVANGVTTLNNTGDNALRVESTNGNPMYVNVVGTAQNYLFDVRDDGSSKFRVDGSGNVGIGGSPSDTLSVSSSNTGRTGVSVGNTTTGGRTYIIGSVGSATDGGAAAGSFTIRDGNASANRLTIDSSGNMTINSGNLVLSSGAIDFGSGASTTLDAYEEGTFTGTFRDATSGGNASSTTFPGVYTRIGDVVYFRVGCGNISTSGMTAGNVIYLHGLPFQASASKSGPVNAVQTDTVTTGDYLTVAANAGTSYCDFRKNTSGAGDAQLLVSDLTSGTSDMTVSGYYYV